MVCVIISILTGLSVSNQSMRKLNKLRSGLSQPRLVSRRELLRLALGAGALAFTGDIAMADTIIQRPIPRTGESLPVIGLGTWQTFDVGKGHSEREPLKAVLRDFVRLQGKVIDSSPMYGNSETVVGDLAAELGVQKQLFLATKVWTSGRDAGIRQMEQSFRRLRTQVMDLMQVHNLVDWQTHLDDTQALEGARQGSLHWRDALHGERLRPARPRTGDRRSRFCPAQLFHCRTGRRAPALAPRRR